MNKCKLKDLGGVFMESGNIFEKVSKILVDQLGVDKSKVVLDSSIMDDLGADSLDVVDIVRTLEEEFNLQFPDGDIEGLGTVRDIVNYIESKI